MPDNNIVHRLEQQIRFILEIDKVKQIFRRSYLLDVSRKENDAEHSWHLAMMAMLLYEYAGQPELELPRVMKMVLVHDLVEIDAGDVFIYDEQGAVHKAEIERTAADRIFAILPPDQAAEIRGLWDEFEERVTPESRFARAIDRLEPLLLNYYTQGKSWLEHGITVDKVLKVNMPVITEGTPALAEYVERMILESVAKGYLFPTPI